MQLAANWPDKRPECLVSSLINGESLSLNDMATLTKQVNSVQVQRLSEKTLQ